MYFDVIFNNFIAEEISGKNLSGLEKSDLKDIGVKTLGRRIELMNIISQLLASSSGNVH
ncbi:MAG: hypothetical protein DSY43_01245 [Gammaproteobacteria bacterium]|nr:MAG: hypothetical protein DSY43_01245 [Gammaproteobacteria bacterium]